MTQSSFYGDTPNFANDYPTQNDPPQTLGGNTAAKASFYPNGTDYEEADPELAANSASQAAASAAAALASQTDAASSASAAANSATSAASSASGAATSKAAADTDATNAASSASAAATSASTASTGATNAANSATAAAGSASAASTSATNAANSATAASGSATAASGSASAASTSASNAATSASNAATSASNAATAVANAAGTATPLAAGTAAVGTSAKWAHEDHVHPVAASVRYDVAQGLTATQKAQARANIDALKKNYIVNGGMVVSQENGSTTSGASAYFPVDQFATGISTAGTISIGQAASLTPGGSPNRIRATATAADATVDAGDSVYIYQPLEGLRVADLKFGTASAKTITIQFGVKAPAGTYCVALWNSAGLRSYVAEYTIAAGEANTDVVKSVVIPGDVTGTWPSDNTRSILVFWSLMAGSSYQTPAGTWTASSKLATTNQFNFMGTNGNVFELFDVGLYEGTVAPSFQLPDLASETLLCQRYFYNIATTLNCSVFMAAAYNTTQAIFHWPFPVMMRAAPTCSATGSGGFRINGVAAIAISSFSFGTVLPQGVGGIVNVSSGLTAGYAYRIEFNAGGAVTANARM